MPKVPERGSFDYPVKVDGTTRIVKAVRRDDGSVRILPPKRPRVITEPTVNTTIPNPRIMASVAKMSRRLVLRSLKAGDPEQYAFGRYYVEPGLISADDSGEYLVLDLLWSVGPVQRVCNGIVPSTSPSGTWDYKLWLPDNAVVDVSPGALHEHFLGTAGQSASAIMTALKGSYDALPNRAHSVISLQQGWNLNILGACDGVEVVDPRTSPHTTAWTENPALILADIFTRCGYTMNWSSVADAADYCDEIGDATYSPGQSRWRVGGVIYDRNSLDYWTHALAQYATCYVDVRGSGSGSEVILIPDKPRSSNHTITAASIVEGTERLTRRGSRDTPSLVTVNYRSDGSVFSASYGTSGGAGTQTTLNMPFWDRMGHAGRKAEETHRKANNPIDSLEFIGWDDGLVRTLGDVGTVTLPSVGLSAQDMALVENEPVQRGRWRRKYIQYDATNYVNSFAGTDLGGAEETINNPYSPPTGPTPTLTAELVTSTSPNYYRITIQFSPVTWAYLQDYKINVYQDGVSPQPILHSEYVTKGSETGSPLTITVYADLSDSPGFQMSIGNSPQTVYRVDVYNRSLWTDQEGNEILSSTPGTATVTDPETSTAVLGAWYPLDEASGTRYNAHTVSSPNLYDMAEYGAGVGQSAGKLTSAADFAGATSPQGYLMATEASSPLPPLMAATTVCGAFWVNFDNIDLGYNQFILRRGNLGASTLNTNGLEWQLGLSKNTSVSPNTYQVALQVGGPALNRLVFVTDVNPSAGTWYFVYFYFDAAAGMGGVSVNDGTVFNTAYDPDPIRADFGNIIAGVFSLNASFTQPYPLDGKLDEIALWHDGTLTADMVTFLYNGGTGRTYAEWVAAYPDN